MLRINWHPHHSLIFIPDIENFTFTIRYFFAFIFGNQTLVSEYIRGKVLIFFFSLNCSRVGLIGLTASSSSTYVRYLEVRVGMVKTVGGWNDRISGDNALWDVFVKRNLLNVTLGLLMAI